MLPCMPARDLCAQQSVDDPPEIDFVDSDSESVTLEDIKTYDELSEVMSVASMIEKAPTMRFVSKGTDAIGDLSVPRYGDANVEEFERGDVLSHCIELGGKIFEAEFEMTSKDLAEDLLQQTTRKYYATLADPDGEDCPLMFVSPRFSDLTGYSSDFCVGRSCRFLQPSNRILNDAVNLQARVAMRAFCSEKKPPGTSIVTLLLNERRDGSRFWNLLKMVYVEVCGKSYIFAMQTPVDAYMPTTFSRQTQDASTNTRIKQLAEGIIEKLCTLRKHLSFMSDAPLPMLQELISERLDKMRKIILTDASAPPTVSPSAAPSAA